MLAMEAKKDLKKGKGLSNYFERICIYWMSTYRILLFRDAY